jgi:hypothetical protein
MHVPYEKDTMYLSVQSARSYPGPLQKPVELNNSAIHALTRTKTATKLFSLEIICSFSKLPNKLLIPKMH